ncbi:unnamed protein product [Cylicocyclus nassatus]|uniref:SCP domain-containing protein n=1 Tax=Cylicocyclus nassatus TaxID=53992 RepID=A0AA36M8T2_CYLNA|nr:unnamed protein product [Cylicocyclus nassatus]
MQQLLCIALLLAAAFPSLELQCIFSDQTPGLPENIQNEVLKLINNRREKLAKGEQINGASRILLPAAKQISFVKWSCQLEEEAAAAIKACPRSEPTVPFGKTAFFNFYYIAYKEKELIPWMQSTWLYPIDVSEFHSSAFDNEVVRYVASYELRAYANLVREDTTEIGCFETKCLDAKGYGPITIYCLTNRPELAVSDVIYHLPIPDTTITTKSTTKTTTLVVTTTTAMPVTTTTKTTSSTGRKVTVPSEFPEFPLTDSYKRCQSNMMNDELRFAFLDMHNYRREQLAEGKIAKRNGNYLPQSADMQRMRYDCQLEEDVISFVSTCPTAKSAEYSRPNIGENFVRFPRQGLATFLAAAKKAVESWWNVILTEEGPGLQLYFRHVHVGTPIESFTQMGWSTSRKLACAVALCRSDFVVVCRYSPKGNNVGRVIYKKGTPCTQCAAGSWCTKDALCTFE